MSICFLINGEVRVFAAASTLRNCAGTDGEIDPTTARANGEIRSGTTMVDSFT